MDEQEQRELVTKVAQAQRLRQGAVVIALVLLVVSLIKPMPALAIVRGLAWCAAGVLSLIETQHKKKLGLPAGYLNAVIYFLVALLPFLRGR